MNSTSVYGLKFSVLGVAGGKALAMDHGVDCNPYFFLLASPFLASSFRMSLYIRSILDGLYEKVGTARSLVLLNQKYW